MPRKAQPVTRRRRPGAVPDRAQGNTSLSNSSEPPSDSNDSEKIRPPKRVKRSKKRAALESYPKPPPKKNKKKGPEQYAASPKDSTKGPSSLSASKSPKRAKYDFSANATSPFPTWLALSLIDVQTVFRLLEDKHGKIEMSQSKPSLGLQIEGCNEEEPALINAIIRARLSAGTNDMNASRAFIGILETFGRRKPGSTIGIVDWEAVRLAPVEDLYEAIKTGGMGNVKSRSNVVRRKQGEIPVKADGTNLLTLEQMRSLSKDEAFEKFITFPGVGPKTAACIISICM
ncbi:hypothetical protein BKA61DRAFT_631668 [Leptodontidium sp. MPI-SDFR-AT-0119]|nr:hypothetical protein BKA61DRAFT_631668 [Leptodontidium sp. MPI-SDFR-AT-0119]